MFFLVDETSTHVSSKVADGSTFKLCSDDCPISSLVCREPTDACKTSSPAVVRVCQEMFEDSVIENGCLIENDQNQYLPCPQECQNHFDGSMKLKKREVNKNTDATVEDDCMIYIISSASLLGALISTILVSIFICYRKRSSKVILSYRPLLNLLFQGNYEVSMKRKSIHPGDTVCPQCSN